MALEKVTAIIAGKPAQKDALPAQDLPTQGDIVKAAFENIEGEDLLVTADGKLTLRLAGLTHLAGDLSPGDMLLMRVLSTSPRLTLSLIDTVRSRAVNHTPSGEGSTLETSSMRLDQLALRQIAWPRHTPETLSTAWRAQVIASLGQKDAPATSLPLGLLPTLDSPAKRQNEIDSMLRDADRWIFTVPAWEGLRVLLRLIDVDTERPRTPRRQCMVGLLLEFELPGFGRMNVQIQLGGRDVILLFWIEDIAVQLVRNALPAIASALACIGLRLRSCRLASSKGNDIALPSWNGNDLPLVRQALTTALFRSGTEVMQTLISAHAGIRGIRNFSWSDTPY